MPYESVQIPEEENKRKYQRMKTIAKDIREMDDIMNQENKNDNEMIIHNSQLIHLINPFLEKNVLRDLDLNLDIDYRITQEMTEEGKKKYQELKEKLESMKNFDAGSYIDNIER